MKSNVSRLIPRRIPAYAHTGAHVAYLIGHQRQGRTRHGNVRENGTRFDRIGALRDHIHATGSSDGADGKTRGRRVGLGGKTGHACH